MRIYNLRAKCLALLTILVSTFAQAEILVILPETGTMANATDSIKRGLLQANHQANSPYTFRFVNLDQKNLSAVLKKNINKNTQMIIGPLDKKNVEEIIKLQPKITTLALNQVGKNTTTVLQFALSKEEDALALTKKMQQDGVKSVLVLRDPDSMRQTQSFYDAMLQLWGDKMQIKQKLPFLNLKKQGILLLGSSRWLNEQKLPKKYIYTLPFAIEEKHPVPDGLVYCDTPALYVTQWTDVIDAYRQKPVNISFQRLIAFGADTWQIMDQLLKRKNQQVLEFYGRTGKIRVVDNIISRQPQCFEAEKSGTIKVFN